MLTLLGEVVPAVLLVELQLIEVEAFGGRELGSLDASTKRALALRSSSSGSPRDAGHVDGGKEDVAELVPAWLGVKLCHLCLEIGERALPIRVLEPDRGRAPLHFLREKQRRGVSERDGRCSRPSSSVLIASH